MTDEERELDLMVADLISENKLLKTKNEELQHQLDLVLDEAARFKTALARILAVSDMAFRDCAGKRVGEVCAPTSAVQRQATGLL